MTGKNIVFIAPEFFSFHKQIQGRLQELGNTVYFIPDRPSQKAIVKILIRKFRFLLKSYLDNFFARRAAAIPADQIDEVFIIRGEGLTADALESLRARFKKARFQLYLWDSVARSPGCMDLVPLVARTWTYDLKDSKKYPEFHFTPNFFTWPQTKTFERAPAQDFKWHLAFFGTAHADRLKVVAKISDHLPADIRFFRFFYFQSPILYYFRKFFDPAFSKFAAHEKSMKPRFGEQWEEIVRETSAILDIQHPAQGGLTIRTLETLALGFKLVTTDPTIREYEFFNPEQIQVINREDPRIDAGFLKKPNRFAPHPKILELELSHWIKKIFA